MMMMKMLEKGTGGPERMILKGFVGELVLAGYHFLLGMR